MTPLSTPATSPTPVSNCQRGRFITFGNTRSTDRRGIGGDALDVEVNVGSRGGDIPRRRHVLGRVSIDPASSRQLQATADASQVFEFSYDLEREGSGIRARMFAPRLGIAEDSATGGAAAALAATWRSALGNSEATCGG